MSSYGGETPVNVSVITSIATGGSGVKYTVPTGRYAKLSVLIGFGYAGTGGRAVINIGGVRLEAETTSTNLGKTPEDWMLTEGQTIDYTSGGGSSEQRCLIVITEFNNP